MATSLIVTPNNTQHRAKDNSWYVLHVMANSRDEFIILDPVSYKRDDGSTRYKAKLPILLSITSTEENEVLMDVSDVFRCYKIPYSRYLRLQMYVDGNEVKPPGCHGAPNISQHKARDNSWYVLYVKTSHANDYEKLDPEECRIDDGRVRYKVKLPILVKTDDAGTETLMSIDDICKQLNVPSPFLNERFAMYVDGEEVEHPENKITRRSFSLPVGPYYVGDPFYVLNEKEISQFWEYDNETFFKFWGHQVICIKTGSDGCFPIYEFNKTGVQLDDNKSVFDKDTPVFCEELLVDTASIAFIPLEILGVSLKEAIQGEVGENGLILNCKPDAIKDGSSLEVEVFYSYRYRMESVDTVRFLGYEVLIADKEKYEDD
jgi:hypothetical protein